ncbi:WD40 repeat domain-containing protein [Actinomadura soli]|nr:WD40 repeat domain-containing protein [Actinomadura soli]
MDDAASVEFALREVLLRADRSGDHETLARLGRSVQYWARRLSLADVGDVDHDVAMDGVPGLAVIRDVILRHRHLIRSPDKDWRVNAGVIMLQLSARPDGADLVHAAEKALGTGWLHSTLPLPAPADQGLVRTLSLGGDGVQSVKVLGDGERLVSGHSDGSVAVWDLRRGQCVARRQGHSGPLWSVDVSPADGRVTTADSERIEVWDPARPEAPPVTTEARGAMVKIAYDPAGLRLMHVEKGIRLYDADLTETTFDAPLSFRLLNRLFGSKGDGSFIRNQSVILAASVLANYLLGLESVLSAVLIFGPLGCYSLAGMLWPFACWRRPLNLEHAKSTWITAAGYSPRGESIATVDGRGRIQLWCARTGRLRKTFRRRVAGLRPALSFAPDGKRLAVIDGDGELVVADFESGRVEVAEVLDGADEAGLLGFRVAHAQDGKFLAVGGGTKLYVRPLGASRDASADVPLRVPLHLRTSLVHVEFIDNADRILAADIDSTVRIWDYRGQTEQHQAAESPARFTRDAEFSPDGTWLAVAGEPGGPLVCRSDGSVKAVVPEVTGLLNSVSIAPDGTWLATGCADGRVRLWLANGYLLATLADGPEDMSYFAVRIAGDGDRIIAGAGDGTVRVWGRDGTLRARFSSGIQTEGEISLGVQALAELGGGALAVAGWHEDVGIWTINGADGTVSKRSSLTHWTGERPRRGAVGSLAASPDGTLLVSGATDGTVMAWPGMDPDDGRALVTLDSSITGLSFSPDGTMLAAVSQGGEIGVFSAADGRPIAGTRCDSLVSGCAWSPDGTRIACSSSDGLYHLELRRS